MKRSATSPDTIVNVTLKFARTGSPQWPTTTSYGSTSVIRGDDVDSSCLYTQNEPHQPNLRRLACLVRTTMTTSATTTSNPKRMSSSTDICNVYPSARSVKDAAAPSGSTPTTHTATAVLPSWSAAATWSTDMTIERNQEVYIGDGLYASCDGFSIRLRAPREHID